MDDNLNSESHLTIASLQNLTKTQLLEHVEIICRIIANEIAGVPQECVDYLKSSLSVDAYECRQFVQNMPGSFLTYLFKKQIGLTDKILNTKNLNEVHPFNVRSTPPNSFTGIYSRLFFTKVIYSCKNETGYYGYLDDYACIFPFKIFNVVPEYNLTLWISSLDDNFFSEMQIFLNEHFDELNAREISLLLLRNILHFKNEYFSEIALHKRLKVITKLSPGEEKIQDYLDTFPRLNDIGVIEYLDAYKKLETVLKLNKKQFSPSIQYDHNYFKYLPELNFTELYSLLDSNLFNYDRKKYIYTFQKYLFFFIHASKSPAKPIHFIDDALFECLKSLRFFKICNEDSPLIIPHLALLSLVYLRLQPNVMKINLRIDWKVLKNIKSYVLKIPNLQNSQINLCLKTDYLYGWMLLKTIDACYDIRFSNHHRNNVSDFYDRIFCSSLSKDSLIKRIVIYNAFLGKETVIDMPSNVDMLEKFARFFINYDFSQDLSAIEFITKKHQHCYEPGTL